MGCALQMRYSARSMTTKPPITRDAALATLRAFLDRVPAYSARRSFVTPDNRDVSLLSPYLRRRLVTEEEVVKAVLERHSFQVAEKFVQEVVWRTYWKGWLERNPSVWTACVERESALVSQQSEAPWGEVYQRASRGETHLSFFNDWIHELVTTGYLHNHARMWFASAWIFTLKLPWQLGAMFMYRHLLDGDPASNTLSWRWVAGLQTKGKSYLARPDNIATFSEGRWSPKPGDLAEHVTPVQSDHEAQGNIGGLRLYSELPTNGYGVLTTGDDLSVEQDQPLMSQARSIALLRFHKQQQESEIVEAFAQAADADALLRFGARGRAIEAPSDALAWSQSEQLSRVVIVRPPVGPNSTKTDELAKALEQAGVECFWYQRSWDRQLYELAEKGFFPFWERVKKRIQKGDPLFHGKIGAKRL
jgi:deoxyribodipyrimidine photo-lyase